MGSQYHHVFNGKTICTFIINIIIMFLIESTDVLSIRNIIIILLFVINMFIMFLTESTDVLSN